MLLPFENSNAAHVFRWAYQGPPRPLKTYLLERYAGGRPPDWAHSFYPQRVRKNEAQVDATSWVTAGDRMAYLHLREEEPPLPGPLRVLYQDPWMVVIHKPDGVPVSPGGVFYFSSLAIWAREALGQPDLTPIHRLDLETDGPVVFVRQKAHLARFHQMFAQQTLHKRYRALVHGVVSSDLQQISGRIAPDPNATIHTRLVLFPQPAPEPPQSLTRIHQVRVLWASGKPFSELTLEPVTGKTNQLRVHLAAVGHPIVGDKKYHPDPAVFLDWLAHRDYERLRPLLLLRRQALQCHSLAFTHPFTGEAVEVVAPPEAWGHKLGELTLVPGEGVI